MNFEPLRTFQLSAEHTMRLTQAPAPVLAEWGIDILIFTPGSTVLPWSQRSHWYIPAAGEVAMFWHVALKRTSATLGLYGTNLQLGCEHQPDSPDWLIWFLFEILL